MSVYVVSFKEARPLVQPTSLQYRIASGRASGNLSLRGGGRADLRIAIADYVRSMTKRHNRVPRVEAVGAVDGDRLTEARGGAIFDSSQSIRVVPLGQKNRQYLDFTTVDIERVVGTTHSLEPAFREPSGGSIDRDGKDSADDGEELYRKHHGVGR